MINQLLIYSYLLLFSNITIGLLLNSKNTIANNKNRYSIALFNNNNNKNDQLNILNNFNSFGISNSSYNSIDHITFVSSNANKIKEVKQILGDDYPIELRIHSIDLVEPQAPPVEVSRWKCMQATKFCNGPVIVEDTSLCFNALNGLPGPYIKWFYESIGNHGLAKLIDGYSDKTAYAQCVVSFCLGPGHEVVTFVGSTDGTICYPQGPQGFGWDPIFKPLGYNQTFAEMTREDKNKLSHRFKAFREFKSFLNKRHIGS